jgi:hypothetical protein
MVVKKARELGMEGLSAQNNREEGRVAEPGCPAGYGKHGLAGAQVLLENT